MINELKFILKILKSNANILKRPYKLNLYLTDKCNCKCKTCNIWKKKNRKELNTKELSEFFKKNNYFSWIDITGGEIFLRDDIDKIFEIIIKECKDLFFLHFPTNGLLTEKIYNSVAYIKKHFKGELVITVSIDGPKKIHDFLKGRCGCWEKAVRTFQKVNSINKGNVFFGYTLSKYNAGKLAETIKELKIKIPELTFDRMHVNVAQESKFYYFNIKSNLLKNKKDIVKDISFILSNRKLRIKPFYYIETKFLELLKKYVLNNKYPIKKCTALNSTVTINPKGNVFPCLFFDKKLGSLRNIKFNLDKILFDEESKKLKKDILKYCNNCWSACEAYPSILSRSS